MNKKASEFKYKHSEPVEAVTPEHIRNSGHDGGFFQALANRIERREGKIDWGPSGPMKNGLNISYQFMYPPMIGVEKMIAEMNDPEQDTVMITSLTVADIRYLLDCTDGMNDEITSKLLACVTPVEDSNLTPTKEQQAKFDKMVKDNS